MISEISKVGKYFEGMMWINQLKWKVKDIHLRLSCSNTNLPFLRTFWISQETQGVTSCPILLFQNHTRDNRMRSAYSCCFYYWHVQFCTILWMNAYTLYRMIPYVAFISCHHSWDLGLQLSWFLVKSLPGGKSLPETWLSFISLLSFLVSRPPFSWVIMSFKIWGISFMKETFKT